MHDAINTSNPREHKTDRSGVDGTWYCLLKSEDLDLHVNMRLTAPQGDVFPDHQVITGVAVLTESSSLVIEVKNLYTSATDSCPAEFGFPCLADGDLRIVDAGREAWELLRPAVRTPLEGGEITLSATSLPAQCRLQGADKVSGGMYEDMHQGSRILADTETFEDWVPRFNNGVAPPGWCAHHITQQSLADMHPVNAMFRIEASTITIRVKAGVNHQDRREIDGDGRTVSEIQFWEMDIGFEGPSLESHSSGILAKTARWDLAGHGHAVMSELGAIRSTLADYEVPGALGKTFANYSRL